MRPDRDSWAMALAVVTAERATCLRRKVGAVLLNERGHVLSTGYNGVAAGQNHCNELTGSAVNPALRLDDGSFRRAEHWEVDTIPIHAHA
jgi:deoxycytidylate deaminase